MTVAQEVISEMSTIARHWCSFVKVPKADIFSDSLDLEQNTIPTVCMLCTLSADLMTRFGLNSDSANGVVFRDGRGNVGNTGTVSLDTLRATGCPNSRRRVGCKRPSGRQRQRTKVTSAFVAKSNCRYRRAASLYVCSYVHATIATFSLTGPQK